MEAISKESYFKKRDLTPKRLCFKDHSRVQKEKKPGSVNSFSVKFKESIVLIYENMTRNKLQYSQQFDNYWHKLNSDEEIQAVEEWEKSQGTRVFLRDCLTCSIALDCNLKDNASGEYTDIGLHEHEAKMNRSEKSIDGLTNKFIESIAALPFYNEAKLITAVPQRPGKDFDLPSTIVERIASALSLRNITSNFTYSTTKKQTKEIAFTDKWDEWEACGLSLNMQIENQPVILVDDKYQSGTTANFVAKILQDHGASEVYGLFAVKTLRDTDNL